MNQTTTIPPPYTLPTYNAPIIGNGSIYFILVVLAILTFCFEMGLFWSISDRCLKSSTLLRGLQGFLLYLVLLGAMLAVGMANLTTAREAMAAFYNAVARLWLESGGETTLLQLASMTIEEKTSNVGKKHMAMHQQQQQTAAAAMTTTTTTKKTLPLHPRKVPVPVRGYTEGVLSVDSVIFEQQVPASSICNFSRLTAELGGGTATSTTNSNDNNNVFSVPACSTTSPHRLGLKKFSGSECDSANNDETTTMLVQHILDEQLSWCRERNGNFTLDPSLTNPCRGICTFPESLVARCVCLKRNSNNGFDLAQSKDSHGDETNDCPYVCEPETWVPTSSLLFSGGSSSASGNDLSSSPTATVMRNATFMVMTLADPAVQLARLTDGTMAFPISASAKFGKYVSSFAVLSVVFLAGFIASIVYGEKLLCFRYLRAREDNDGEEEESSNENSSVFGGVNRAEARAAQERQRRAREEMLKENLLSNNKKNNNFYHRDSYGSNLDSAAGGGGTSCKICFEPCGGDGKRMRFMPCRHGGLCEGCAEKIAAQQQKKCPWCRSEIVKVEPCPIDACGTFAASPGSSAISIGDVDDDDENDDDNVPPYAVNHE